MKVIRIAILGAECTGKTSLCIDLKKSLADDQLRVINTPEALRNFCQKFNRVPLAEDQLSIMYEQIQLEYFEGEKGTIDQSTLILSDCAPITTAIYSELYFSDFSLYAEAEKHHSRYDLSILLSPTVGWQSDGIFRENPIAQQKFHDRQKQWLENNRYPWLEISDVGELRSARAISAIIPFIR